ncbi:hypothetical protein [Parasitella parasitica]|uniref:Profilin n=1 Tax=Parasitella parasitica TaxID=35722 RepID=A0A0B7NKX7_9FUNG|nr:hypothetical protein [Parasitella parasitica]
MSWQAYVDNNLLGTGKVSKAAIYGLNGGKWATSGGFELDTNEVQEIIKGFDDNDSIRGSGVKLMKEKYLVLVADAEHIICKKGSAGASIFKTGQAFLVGTYVEGMSPEECNKVVGSLADYLKSVASSKRHVSVFTLSPFFKKQRNKLTRSALTICVICKRN